MNNTITVFEHQSLKIDDLKLRKALEIFSGDKKDFPYYSLIYNGIKFNSYVGVIQVGKTIIEILPKADKDNDENKWRNILIGMLRTVYNFDVKAPTQSSLKIKPNSILELYFEIFVKEVEYLLHTGLSKQYRKIENNLNSLKGKILFSKHIQKNLIHKEKFFVNYTTYDKEHILHKLLYKTLKLLQKINTNVALQSKICALLLNFPEMPDVKVTEDTFNKITYSRKTEAYRNAINIAKLLLLNYHPDIRGGSNSVLAIMFDMNKLWEKFVYKSLRKHLGNEGYEIKEQDPKPFWESRKIKPDIVIKKDNKCWILDTKWKILNDKAKDINDNDLKQMFVYSLYFDAPKVALVYPAGRSDKESKEGKFAEIQNGCKNEKCEKIQDYQKKRTCSLIFIEVNEDIKIEVWQEKIKDHIKSFLDSK